ncbi:hypothetical protein WA158_008375 [Blastocystis sp. Blastoise]
MVLIYIETYSGHIYSIRLEETDLVDKLCCMLYLLSSIPTHLYKFNESKKGLVIIPRYGKTLKENHIFDGIHLIMAPFDDYVTKHTCFLVLKRCFVVSIHLNSKDTKSILVQTVNKKLQAMSKKPLPNSIQFQINNQKVEENVYLSSYIHDLDCLIYIAE